MSELDAVAIAVATCGLTQAVTFPAGPGPRLKQALQEREDIQNVFAPCTAKVLLARKLHNDTPAEREL